MGSLESVCCALEFIPQGKIMAGISDNPAALNNLIVIKRPLIYFDSRTWKKPLFKQLLNIK